MLSVVEIFKKLLCKHTHTHKSMLIECVNKGLLKHIDRHRETMCK